MSVAFCLPAGTWGGVQTCQFPSQDLVLSGTSWHLPGCVCPLGLWAAPVACENKIICVRQRSAAEMSSFVLSGGGRWSAWSSSRSLAVTDGNFVTWVNPLPTSPSLHRSRDARPRRFSGCVPRSLGESFRG